MRGCDNGTGATLDCDGREAALDCGDDRGATLDCDDGSESANGLTGGGHFLSFTLIRVGAVGEEVREDTSICAIDGEGREDTSNGAIDGKWLKNTSIGLIDGDGSRGIGVNGETGGGGGIGVNCKTDGGTIRKAGGGSWSSTKCGTVATLEAPGIS